MPAVLVKVPVPEYGVVPPVAVTFTEVLPPLQLIAPALTLIVNGCGAAGWVIVIDFEDVHPLISFTVMLYVPAKILDRYLY